MPVQRFSQGFKDISLSFKRHPVTNDILALKNEDAIKRSVQNLIRIQLGEVFFNNLLGTRITGALFELANDDFVDPAVKAICSVARKDGDKGRGKIFIIQIEECIRIRTNESGEKAIG